MNQDTQTHCNSIARKGKHITFSELYNYIDQGIIGISHCDMVQSPRKKRKKSIHQRLSHNHTGAISIENRPEDVKRRKDLGHFEMDCVVGPRDSHVAHPYCASERGSNENANRFIRRFFPKGTDLSDDLNSFCHLLHLILQSTLNNSSTVFSCFFHELQILMKSYGC